MYIFIYSHSIWAPSGYGQQTAQLATHLVNAGHKVSIVAIDYHSTPLNFNDIKEFPTRPDVINSYQDLYFWVGEEKPDIVIQLFDAWVIGKPWIDKNSVPIYTFNPVDCSDLPRNFIASCKNSSLHIAMSPNAHKLFKTHSLKPNTYIPHSIDTTFFKPMNKNKAKQRFNFPAGSFIFGIVGTNLTARKNLPGQLLAFSHFLQITKAKNCFLYLHTAIYEEIASSFDIQYLIETLNIKDNIIIPRPQQYLLNNIANNKMLDIYNSIDVLMNCSYGEGFGIPIIEAQSCGKPVIATNCSAMPYTCGKGGILIKKIQPYCDSGHMGWWGIPDVGEIVEAMIMLYEDKELRKDLSHKAIENAKKYDWKIWIPKWLKILEA